MGPPPSLTEEDIIDTARLKKYCASLAGASSTLYGPPSNILVYTVGDKKFAYFKTSEPEKWRFSIRVSPDRFIELTDVPGIKPARYMGRFHWVTIVDPHSLPAKYLAELIDWSYHKALGSLSRQRRDELMALPENG
jgi:predicted DNA-binding protein (MmcQ/YjbR family)